MFLMLPESYSYWPKYCVQDLVSISPMSELQGKTCLFWVGKDDAKCARNNILNASLGLDACMRGTLSMQTVKDFAVRKPPPGS